jgi:hypothetical protein
MFNEMFPLVFSHKPAEYSEKQHQELPEIMGPFLRRRSSSGRIM